MKGHPPQIHGDGEQTRDFTYVDDVIEASLLAALSPKAEGDVFNVSSGKEISINYLAEKMIKMTNFQRDQVYVNRRDIDNIRRRVLNIEKIRRVLRWIPQTTLTEGLEKTYEWLSGQSQIQKRTMRVKINQKVTR